MEKETEVKKINFVDNIKDKELNTINIIAYIAFNTSTIELLKTIIIPDLEAIISSYKAELGYDYEHNIQIDDMYSPNISLSQIFKIQEMIFGSNLSYDDKLIYYATMYNIACKLLNKLSKQKIFS